MTGGQLNATLPLFFVIFAAHFILLSVAKIHSIIVMKREEKNQAVFLMTFHMITNQGTRDYNEDTAACVEVDGDFCFIVADGLGGHGKGEVASGKTVEVFEREAKKRYENNESLLKAAFQSAQDEILAMQEAQNDKLSMKTTAVSLSIIDGKCQWGHVGDSRLYAFKKNKLAERTLDHSVPQMLVLSGDIKEKHISKHPDRNRLLRVIGIEWDSPRYDLSDEFPVSEYQAFLLCTDGFWEFIETKKICKFLKKSKNAEEWLKLMASEVEKNGKGKDMDNYTAIAVTL
jgi:serine/threonine protein phosphatase PrpC